jgi:3'-phosphoadenosine 5'-phosphosulfate sulfotransferase (PAPS reductase)/FAD synthetase
VFVDTGLEYPEIVDFVKTQENVTILKPKMSFYGVIQKYGYPVISKEVSQKISEIRTTKSDKLRDKRLHGDSKGNGKVPEKWKFLVDAPFSISNKCCDVLKKNPVKAYEKETGRMPIVGTMACESRLRLFTYLKNGCNSFSGRTMSMPMAFWEDKDIWEYLKTYNVPYSNIYDMGYDRTGCMFCLFGLHMQERPNRLDTMKQTHPKLHDYCMNKLGLQDVLKFLAENGRYELEEPTLPQQSSHPKDAELQMEAVH